MSQPPAELPRFLPNGEQAVVRRSHLRDYCLNPDHPEGGHKARLWRAMGGYHEGVIDHLQGQLRSGARRAEVTRWRLNPDGSATWSTTMEIGAVNGRLLDVQARWRVTVPGSAPRLVSAWPEVD